VERASFAAFMMAAKRRREWSDQPCEASWPAGSHNSIGVSLRIVDSCETAVGIVLRIDLHFDASGAELCGQSCPGLARES
jgi:hypothetical protein